MADTQKIQPDVFGHHGSLVKNMRNEQQMLRDWIEAQQEEAKSMRRTLERQAQHITTTTQGSPS